jgi:hypothetical protein
MDATSLRSPARQDASRAHRHQFVVVLRQSGFLVTLMAGVIGAGCSPARPAPSAAPSAAASSGDRYTLTEAELQTAQDRTLYETIERLRPTFLRSRQVASSSTPIPEPVHVVVDGNLAAGLETLRLFSPAIVKQVRFYEPHQANVRFGTGHHGGLIEVILRR